jgi:putative transposase
VLGVSQATAYRLVRLFRERGTVSSLVDRKRGRRKDHRTLDKEREEIIRTAIARFYLKPTRPPFSRLVREVQTNCVSAGVRAQTHKVLGALSQL